MVEGDGLPDDVLNLRGLAGRARPDVPEAAYGYIAGGSGDEVTLSANVEAWGGYRLRHRTLRDVSERTAATTVLGTDVDMPVLVAPTAFHGLVHEGAEAATARGAAAAGTLMCASTLSNTALEDVADASDGPQWFQLYIYRDRSLTEDLVDRAEAAGYEAIVVTVDSPVWGRRERDVANDFTLPDGLTLANFPDLDQETLPTPEGGGNALAAYVEEQLDPALTWEDVAWLRERTDLPVLVKGIVHPADAREAARRGVDGIVVSNHGGRQLDAGVATVDALPGVVDAVQEVAGPDGPEVYVDGGVRRGTDVLKALCLGAQGVLVGRPVLWSLALGGARGVRDALTMLRDEVDNALALAGLRSPEEAGRDLVERVPPGP